VPQNHSDRVKAFELVARVGGVAKKGAAELASAPDEREC
jgi:hypothetical protein